MAKDIHPKILLTKHNFTTGQVFDFNSTSDLVHSLSKSDLGIIQHGLVKLS